MSVRANWHRLAHLTAVLARHGVAHAAGRWLPRRLARRLPVGLAGPDRLRTAFEEMGGTFIKFGQMLALQPDIVSVEYCDALFNLMDRVPPFGMADVDRTFVEEFGRPTSEIFDAFDPTPLATASIGQVHAARLGERKVAVKVRRPTVEREFGGDVRLMAAAIRVVRGLGSRRLEWLLEPMTEFVSWTREELDFRNEARHMGQLRRNAADNPAERVPAVEWGYTSARTLVMEFFDGVTVLDYIRAVERGDRRVLDRLARTGFDPNRFARNVIDNFLGDAFRHGLFHADLHPANLMILPDNVVGYIDFGITGVLSGYSRRHLTAMTLAYTRGDLDGMCKAFFRVSSVGPGADPAGFRAGIGRLAEAWYEVRQGRRRLRKNFTLVMLDLLRLSRATNIWPEKDVIKYIRSAIASDGLITRFAPGFEIGTYLGEVCRRQLSREVWAHYLSHTAAVDWLRANTRLLSDGLQRVAAVVRAADLDRPRSPGPAPTAPTPGRTAWWAALAAAAAVAANPATPFAHDRAGVAAVAAAVLVGWVVIARRRTIPGPSSR
jgi:ubiquinone biosynthesis protein